MSLFLIIAIIGAILLAVSLIFGEIFEAFDSLDIAPDGVLSGASIGGFFTGFGAFGIILSNTTKLSTVIIAVLAVVGGLALGGIAVALTRFFKSQETDGTHLSTESLLGVVGVVIMGGTAGTLCSGRFPFNGASRDLTLRSDTDLEDGQSVIIKTILSHSTVKVEPFTD